jgi:hypothetical protein
MDILRLARQFGLLVSPALREAHRAASVTVFDDLIESWGEG